MVNRKTDFADEQKVMGRMFEGQDRKGAARGLVSTGKASSIKEDFITRAERDGLQQAADDYGVREPVEMLLDVAKKMKDEGIAFGDVEWSAKFWSMYDKAGLPRETAPKALKIARAILAGAPIEAILDAAIEIVAGEEKSGIRYDDAVTCYQAAVDEIQQKGEEERRKTTEHVQLEERRLKDITKEQEKRAEKAMIEVAQHLRESMASQEQLKDLNGEKVLRSQDLDVIKSEKESILKRADKLEEMEATFVSLGVPSPELKAKVLIDMGQISARKAVALVDKYGGLEHAVSAKEQELLVRGRQLEKVYGLIQKYSDRCSTLESDCKVMEDRVLKQNDLLRESILEKGRIDSAVNAGRKSIQEVEEAILKLQKAVQSAPVQVYVRLMVNPREEFVSKEDLEAMAALLSRFGACLEKNCLVPGPWVRIAVNIDALWKELLAARTLVRD